jgi:hypothetical protein
VRRQSAGGQDFDCLRYGDAHDAFWLIDPGVAVQDFVFLGADGPEIQDWSLLQLRLGKELGGFYGGGDTGGFLRLEILQESPQQCDRDNAHDYQSNAELADRPDVDIRRL